RPAPRRTRRRTPGPPAEGDREVPPVREGGARDHPPRGVHAERRLGGRRVRPVAARPAPGPARAAGRSTVIRLGCLLLGHRWEEHHALPFLQDPRTVYWCPRCGETEIRDDQRKS